MEEATARRPAGHRPSVVWPELLVSQVSLHKGHSKRNPLSLLCTPGTPTRGLSNEDGVSPPGPVSRRTRLCTQHQGRDFRGCPAQRLGQGWLLVPLLHVPVQPPPKGSGDWESTGQPVTVPRVCSARCRPHSACRRFAGAGGSPPAAGLAWPCPPSSVAASGGHLASRDSLSPSGAWGWSAPQASGSVKVECVKWLSSSSCPGVPDTTSAQGPLYRTALKMWHCPSV